MPLTAEQITRYREQGYLCPLNILDAQAAVAMRTRFEALEERASSSPDRQAMFKNNVNWVVPFADELTRNKDILNVIGSLLGDNLLALSVDMFIKEPGSGSYVSWHQDLHYWGLEGDDVLTAWLALSPATRESGCMRFLPGSHKTIVDHRDTFAGDNLLTRGQEVAVEVNERDAVYAELQAGQMSVHHGRLFHASTPNRSNDRRIGVAIRYAKTSVGQASAGERFGATLVAGEDRFGHFELVATPRSEFDPSATAHWQRLREIREAVLYAGTKTGS